jgi:hypothetical protein
MYPILQFDGLHATAQALMALAAVVTLLVQWLLFGRG